MRKRIQETMKERMWKCLSRTDRGFALDGCCIRMQELAAACDLMCSGPLWNVLKR
jgi:hypothetical protein